MKLSLIVTFFRNEAAERCLIDLFTLFLIPYLSFLKGNRTPNSTRTHSKRGKELIIKAFLWTIPLIILSTIVDVLSHHMVSTRDRPLISTLKNVYLKDQRTFHDYQSLTYAEIEISIKSFVRIYWSVSEMNWQHPYNYRNSCYPQLCTKATLAIVFK